MNILKRSRVLNRNCLREKIQSLSPLLRTLDIGPPSKDSVFRASWSYYASDCQERLSNIRRRIAQNARIVAPKKGPLSVLPFNESLLPPGVDLDEHIYQELVSCFRNAESTDSVKKTSIKASKVQGFFDMRKFSTPEQWSSWKQEEQQVHQLLEKSYDPYLKEEMTKKLEHLQKLTKRRPLVVLPNQEKNLERQKKSQPKKRKFRAKSRNKSKSEVHQTLKSNTKMADKYKTPKNSSHLSEIPLKSATENKYSKNSSKIPNHLADRHKPSSANLKNKSITKIEDNNKTASMSSDTPKNIAIIHSRKSLSQSASKSKSSISVRKTAANFSDKLKPTLADLTMSRFFAEHPSLESISSSRRTTYTKLPRPKPTERVSESSQEEDGIYGIDEEKESQRLDTKDTQLITREIFQKDRNSQISTKTKQRKIKIPKYQQLKEKKLTKDEEISEDIPPLSQISQNESEIKSKSKEMTKAKQSKSEGKLQIEELKLSKITKDEQTYEERRQSFVSKGKSHSLINIPYASHQYIHEILKGLTKSDPSLFGAFKGKHGSPIFSPYKGQSYNDTTSGDQRREKSVTSGGWSISLKPSLPPVNPMAHRKPYILKKKALREMAQKDYTIEPEDSTEIRSVRGTLSDLPFKKTPESLFRSKNDSEDDVHLNIEAKPIVIADMISQFLDSYGSEISFIQSYPDLFRSNVLEQISLMSVIEKIKPKKKKKRVEKKVLEVKKMPSKHFVCSLCNLVRRRQSELRPYMQRMQKQRERLEQKTYYAQKLSRCRRDPQQCALENQKRAHIRRVLSKCYKALDLCHQIVEQKILQKSEGCYQR
ncbi:uncharacterized protein LOC108022237 [Drosophila biarmipes]|uniref:uncharacterized protein LOC108022237 n=1 Tax=Drosophila biarmipes TaxID=125945 RepID=UPI0007E6B100|nr:uncharacterized protein LOC108022237 [Drosophila biarmipes]